MHFYSPAQRPIFICYRQIDGLLYAQWLYDVLRKTPPLHDTLIYFDHTAPAGADWRVVHEPTLRLAGTLIVVVSPGLRNDYGKNDAVHGELDWWLQNRSAPPILVDPFDDPRLVPDKIKKRWPSAQRVHLDRSLWAANAPDVAARAATQVAEQILHGIDSSEFQVVRQDLERSKALNRKFRSALVILCIAVCVAAVLAVVGEQQHATAQAALDEQARQSVALRANELAARSEQLVASNPAAALVVAVEAVSTSALPSTLHALYAALVQTRSVYTYLHVGANSIAFSRDGERLYGLSTGNGFGDSAIRVNEWELNHYTEIGPPYQVDYRNGPPHAPVNVPYMQSVAVRGASDEDEGNTPPGGGNEEVPRGVAVAVSPDRALVAAGVGRVVVWSVRSHRVVRRIVPAEHGRPEFFTKLAFVDGDTLVTWRERESGGILERWSVRRGTRSVRALYFGDRYEKEAAFIERGTRLVVVRRGDRRRLEFWDTLRQTQVRTDACCLRAPADQGASHLESSDMFLTMNGLGRVDRIIPGANDSDFVTVTSTGGPTDVAVWRPDSRVASAMIHLDYAQPDFFVALSPERRVLAMMGTPRDDVRSTADRQQYISLWWNTGGAIDSYRQTSAWFPRTPRRGYDRLSGELLAFNPRRDMFAAADDAGATLGLTGRDVTLSGALTGLRSRDDGLAVPRYDFHSDQITYIETAVHDPALPGVRTIFHVLNAGSGTEKQSVVRIPTHATVLGTDGRHLAFRMRGGPPRLAEFTAGPPSRIIGNSDDELMLFDHSGNSLALAGRSVRIVDSASSRIIAEYPTALNEPATHLAFSPNDEYVAWASRGKLFIGTARAPFRSWHLPYDGADITAFAFDPLGAMVAVGNADGRVETWAVRSSARLAAIPKPFEADGAITAIAVDAHGRIACALGTYLPTAAINVYQQDLEQQRLSLVAELPGGAGVWWLTFTSSGDILGVDSDKSITLWKMNADIWMRLACTRANLLFSADERHRYFGSTTYQPRCKGGTLRAPGASRVKPPEIGHGRSIGAGPGWVIWLTARRRP